MSAAAGAGPGPSATNDVETITMLKDAILSYMEKNPTSSHKLILMVGGADFFYIEKTGIKPRTNPYELFSLVRFFQKRIDPNKEDQSVKYHVLCFDKYYRIDTIYYDMEEVNKKIYMLEKNIRYININKELYEDWKTTSQHKILDIDPYSELDNKYTHKNLSSHNIISSAVFGNAVQFIFVKMNLETSYPKIIYNTTRLFEYSKGETLVKTSVEECIPKENSTMEALQTLCQTIPFQDYYLYNCAWIKGTIFHTNTNNKIYRLPEKSNRHFELMCELLYIFLHLGKPAYLLTASDMDVFTHTKKETADPLHLIPLNNTTLYAKEKWTETPNEKKGGTRKKKSRKSRRWRK